MLPLSILGGALIISVGLYLGLSSRAAPPTPATSAVQSPTGTATTAAPTADPYRAPDAPPQPASSVRPISASQAEAEKAIASLRKEITDHCWAPHKGDDGIPKKLKFIYSGSFDATGIEVARGLSEERGAVWGPVSTCARDLKMNLKIPAPGTVLNVTIPFEVP
jgi:hypothetical protein